MKKHPYDEIAEDLAKKTQVTVTDMNGKTRMATYQESQSFKRFCSYLDTVDDLIKRNATLDWNWQHTGGGINLAYLPVTLKKTPKHTKTRKVEISLGDEILVFHPFRIYSDPKITGEEIVTCPDGSTIDMGDIPYSEANDLGYFDQRFEGISVYGQGWKTRVSAWCKEHIQDPNPDHVAKDIIRIIETNSLSGGKN